ncbi:MAG: hypothetical protein L0J74_03040 [Corynebacterium sp.]|nr:hypothetical protein [Corynebacterium sp.]MDN5723010.1 hypothetical protein [Corynebacterium sp.]MDN6304771.1 hypothetical protein [Corynebacterium sp.]MDN6354424.1 hypothetical protein [Corynebacterium sp.]MDN6366205.1 hypothetical protein [Corynebacterium sp.]MDN6374673.1 hypothetical protein [Corynebacterium sp.]
MHVREPEGLQPAAGIRIDGGEPRHRRRRDVEVPVGAVAEQCGQMVEEILPLCCCDRVGGAPQRRECRDEEVVGGGTDPVDQAIDRPGGGPGVRGAGEIAGQAPFLDLPCRGMGTEVQPTADPRR